MAIPQRWKHAHNAVGHGHLYQRRFKSFPVQEDEHLLTLLRYVERNPVRGEMVTDARDWRWSSCHVRGQRGHELYPLLADWPVDRPSNWTRRVNQPQTAAEEAAVRLHITRGRPMGEAAWVGRMARNLNLEKTLRDRGRPEGSTKSKEIPVEME